MECKVWIKAKTRNDKPVPFLIYGRPRSGTTLLVDILNQVPDIRCDGELLHDLILRPVGFLRDLPKRSGPGVTAYGVKLLSYQLMDVQRVTRPIAFFDKIMELDYKIIHLTRNTWDQNLSLIKAQHSGLYFGEAQDAKEMTIDPAKFLRSLKWNMAMLDYENEVMQHINHIPVHYDTDLRTPDARNKSVSEICQALGIDTQGVFEPTLQRTGGRFGPQKIANMPDILSLVRSEGLAHMIPDTYNL